jgi:hypothetical protein
MFSREQGPEWVLSTFASDNPEIQNEIRHLTRTARRLWPRVRGQALSEQRQKHGVAAFAHIRAADPSVFRPKKIFAFILTTSANLKRPMPLSANLFRSADSISCPNGSDFVPNVVGMRCMSRRLPK